MLIENADFYMKSTLCYVQKYLPFVIIVRIVYMVYYIVYNV